MAAERTLTLPTHTDVWPSLPLAAWRDTYATLHMWMQVIGKIRLALSPMMCHWWQVTLYITPRGLTTSPIPYGTRIFQIDFDFLDHKLLIQTADGETRSLALVPRSVADFYRETMAALRSLGIEVRIWTTPVEVEDRTPFEQDDKHAAYDPEYAQRCWRVLAQATRVLTDFRSRFIGKVSPVHFFWGAFDLAVTRFSGRPAPKHPGAPLPGQICGARSVLARGKQLWVLAGRRRCEHACLLRLCLSGARGFQTLSHPAKRGLLQ